MALYGLTDSELFWDQGSDTKMLMAWSRTCVVCAFRGTASFNNAMSDLQVCRRHSFRDFESAGKCALTHPW